jgi:hypothetical protein
VLPGGRAVMTSVALSAPSGRRTAAILDTPWGERVLGSETFGSPRPVAGTETLMLTLAGFPAHLTDGANGGPLHVALLGRQHDPLGGLPGRSEALAALALDWIRAIDSDAGELAR